MLRKSKSPTDAVTQRRGRPRGRAWSPTVADLAQRYDRFRAENPKGTRIPEELRSAAVEALARGAVPSQVERACRISSDQVKAWRRAKGRDRAKARPAPIDAVPRIFSVVDEPSGLPREPVPSTPGNELEFRLGPWSVSVRLAGRG